MNRPLFLPLASCTQPSLVGGKALGLARLLAGGFPIPPGLCITTGVYRDFLEETGIEIDGEWLTAVRGSKDTRVAQLERIRSAILNHTWRKDVLDRLDTAVNRLGYAKTVLWAVRSSATNEDAGQASFAGVYRTHLGVPVNEISGSVQSIWASIWDERVFAYQERSGPMVAPPAMAVVIQPLLDARAAGVAYSIHPMTGQTTQVVINAVAGLALPLVEGRAMPDQYVIEVSEKVRTLLVRERTIARQTQSLRVTGEGLCEMPLSHDAVGRATLSDDELFELAWKAKAIEKTFGHPVDLEWLYDDHGLWLLQARPIARANRPRWLTNDDCEWSRANFKETLPELPSPLGLSFLELFMERFIVTPYRRLGCRIPEGFSSVRVFQGRPYINATLLYSLVAQLRGNPALMTEQMGGEGLTRVPETSPIGWSAFARAGLVMMAEMRKAVHNGPAWFADMKALAVEHHPDRLRNVPGDAIASRLDVIGQWLDEHELTFAIAGGVSQCLQALGRLLPRWLGEDWRALLNGALQGQAAVISAQQIVRLAELADIVRREPPVLAWFTAERWDPLEGRDKFEGTDFLKAFRLYLEDYGHRGVGESDVMSPRFSDKPELLLGVLRTQILGANRTSPSDILQRQAAVREAALAEIRVRFGWRLHRWVIFSWWYRRLCRFFALREANRHHLMYYSAAMRSLLLRLGEWLVEQTVLTEREDIFYLTLQERAEVLAGSSNDWKGMVQDRRTERARWARISVPDTIRDWNHVASSGEDVSTVIPLDGILRGTPISGGRAVGPVRCVRSIEDWSRVRRGDILVVAVIDPGMAPLFGVAAGLVAEMGGTLSHGAIIAREFGLPAVANVSGIISRLKEGDRISLDADRGEIILQAADETCA